MSPLVFAHRGSSEAFAEHTLDAYHRAIDEGVDGLECDVRLTRDGHLICIHDGRLDRTSNGRGRVGAATLPELEKLDFGSWHASPAQVLTLRTLIETALAAGRPLRLLIETKHPARRGGEVEQRVVEMLREYGVDGTDPSASVRVTVMSFYPLALRRMRQLAPQIPTVFLYETALFGAREGRGPFGARLLGPGVPALRARPEVVVRAHEQGHQVYVWTVNTPEEMEFVLGLGVDGVISDRPAAVLARLSR